MDRPQIGDQRPQHGTNPKQLPAVIPDLVQLVPVVRPAEVEQPLKPHEYKWRDLCGLVAKGMKTDSACEKCGISSQNFRRYLREDQKMREQLDLARGQWMDELWPEERIEKVMLSIAGGSSLKDTSEKMKFAVEEFHNLRIRDTYVNELFERARAIQAEGFADELIELADNTDDDLCEDGRGGQRLGSGTQRSKLRVETRRWVLSRILSERYDKKPVSKVDTGAIVDHAATLENARLRVERMRARAESGG